MLIFKNLYLTDRVFYCLATCIFLFAASFLVDFIFYLTLTLLSGIVLVMLLDVYVLFKTAAISAGRETGSIFSLNDKNKITLTITNLSSYQLSLKIIDEIPYQFNERDFLMQTSLGKSKTEIIHYHVVPFIRGEYLFGNLHVFIKTKLGLVLKKETTFCEKPVAV